MEGLSPWNLPPQPSQERKLSLLITWKYTLNKGSHASMQHLQYRLRFLPQYRRPYLQNYQSTRQYQQIRTQNRQQNFRLNHLISKIRQHQRIKIRIFRDVQKIKK